MTNSENRAEDYLQLIQLIIDCKSNEELTQLLNSNSNLVDQGLIQTMLFVAENMPNENLANYLQGLANNLTPYISQNKSSATSEDYYNFLMQLLQIVQESNGNQAIVYPFLRQNLDKINLNFSSTIQKWWENTLPNIEASQRSDLATIVFTLGNLFQQFPFNKPACLEISIACYELALQEWRQEVVPLDWATTQNNLGIAYRNRVEGNRRENIENAINCYQLALQERRQEVVPLDWATTQNNLGEAYRKRIEGDRKENLEKAINCYQLALEEWRQDNVPLNWATTQNNLGIAYLYRVEGDRRENIENAINCYQLALEEWRQEVVPLDWATTQNNLGLAYTDRIAGDRRENIENAINCYKKALEERRQEVVPLNWADTQNNLGLAYTDRIEGDRRENLESAIACCKLALQERRQEVVPLDWAGTQNNLANAYLYRIEGDRRENLENAINCYKKALQERRQEVVPLGWAMTQNNLATAYSDRIEGDRRENLEKAINCYKKALQERRQEVVPLNWAMTQNNLGITYLYRVEGDRRENIENAINCYQLALQEWRQEVVPLDWATTQNNLGLAYTDRIAGDRRENIENAINCYKKALQERRQEVVPLNWAMTQNNLANAYSVRIAGDKRENIENAINCYKKALQERRQEVVPLDWAMTQDNLANAYSVRIAGDRRENLENAIACYQLVLQERRQDNVPLDWAGTQNNLGIAYSDRIEGDRKKNREKAINCYQLALQKLRPDNVPLDCLTTRGNLGNLYFDEENWQQALESYQIALEIIEDTRLQSLDEKRRQEIIAENIIVFIRIVQCFIELKQYDQAIEYAGRSKTRNLVELITNRDLYPKGDIPQQVLAKLDSLREEIFIETRRQFNQREIKPFNRDSNLEQGMQPTPNLSPVIPDFTYVNQLQKELDQLIGRDINPIDPEFQLTQKVTPISFEEIKALIDDDTVIIEWYFTDKEILTFITTKHDRQPLVKPASSFDEFRKQMSEYLNLYLTDKQNWKTQLPSLLNKFAQILHLEEIITTLKGKYSQIILIPHLYLHLLPLHALPLDTPLTKGGRGKSRLLDHFEQVKYAPSCQLLQLVKNRPPQGLTNLLGIQNPTQDLDYTNIEVETISQIFKPHDDILIKEKATKTALQAKPLEKQHYNHFSCHGYFNFNQPLNSALILAGAKVEQNGNRALPNQSNDESLPEKFIRSSEGETIDLEKCLTLGDVFELDLRQCRLVTLSACETAITDIKSTSDEYISLPSGFLFAGACNVVATQWTVNDLSTAFLMIKFYQLYKIKGLSVAKAMNEAQKWLREVNKKDLNQWIQDNQIPLDATLNMNLKRSLHKLSDNDQPFKSPYYWAAFCAIGK